MDAGLYESKQEAEKREVVLHRIRQVIGQFFFMGSWIFNVKNVN